MAELCWLLWWLFFLFAALQVLFHAPVLYNLAKYIA
jgi:hypothetical protein